MSAGWFATGAVAAGIGVLLGAFGAHGLRPRVDAQLLVVFETGVRYQIYHALALLAVGWAAARWNSPWVAASGWLFLAGILIFSGSLYALVLSGLRWLGAVTPLGGLALIVGWLLLAWGALRGQ